MASDIRISALTATGGVGSVSLLAVWDQTVNGSCLPYMQPAKYRWFASTSNNRALATQVGETVLPLFVHTGLAASTTRYYWVAAVDSAGNQGGYFPVSATGGVSATTNAATASQAALDAAVVDYDAKIIAEQSARIAADGSTASTLNGVSVTATDAQTKANLGTASGLIGFQVTAAPSGFTAAFQLLAKIATAATLRVAGIAVDVTAALARLRLIGDSIVIQDSSGNIFPLFSNGQIAVGRLAAGIINATSLFLNGVQVVATGSILSNAITSMVVTGLTDYAADTTINPTDAGAIKSAAITVTDNASVLCRFTALQDVPASDSANFGTYVISITRDNAFTVVSKPIVYDDNFTSPVILEGDDSPGNGTHTYRIGLLITPNGGRAKWNIKGMQFVLQQYKR